MKKQNRKSWTMAYCGMAAALCVALMLLGAVIPIAMFIAPALAGFLIATVCVECGRTMALTAYAAVSLLALLFVPDKEVALIFVFLLGYYPLAKPRFDRIHPAVLRCVCKLLLCNAAVLAMYGLLPGGQHLTGAAHHGVDSYPVHAGHGQRGLFAVRPGPAQPAHAVPVGVAAQAAPNAGHALRTIVAQQLHKMGQCGILNHQQPTGAAERGNAKPPVDAKRRATRVTAARVTRRGIIENFGGCFSG